MSRTFFLSFSGLLLLLTQGCSASLAQPFDQMKSAPINVYRLQNYEPPAQQQAAAAGAQLQLPPQIQQWITAGAAMLPPGLIPPGLIPGAPAAAPTQTQDLRFHGFRILGRVPIPDQKTHDEVLDILGHEKNFVAQTQGCMFAEFGFEIMQPNGPPADVLVSLSCDQVQAVGFNWPYNKNGLPAETTKRIVAVTKKTFGG
jgi:hypothetical protein